MASVYNLLTRAARFAHLIKKSQTKRIRKLKEKYPKFSDAIDLFVQRDPSGKHKYLEWSLRQAIKGEPVKEIVSLVETFHNNIQRMKNKDIFSYKTLGEIRGAVEKDLSKKTRSEDKAKAYEEADVIYSDDRLLVVHPNSTRASQFFGKGTKWCTSATKSENYFYDYSSDNIFIFYLISKESSERYALIPQLANPKAKPPFNLNEFTIFNEEDKNLEEDISPVDNLLDKSLEVVIGKINTYLEEKEYVTDIKKEVSEIESEALRIKNGRSSQNTKEFIENAFRKAMNGGEVKSLGPIIEYIPEYLNKDQVIYSLNNEFLVYKAIDNLSHFKINQNEMFDIIIGLDEKKRLAVYESRTSILSGDINNIKLLRQLFDYEMSNGNFTLVMKVANFNLLTDEQIKIFLNIPKEKVDGKTRMYFTSIFSLYLQNNPNAFSQEIKNLYAKNFAKEIRKEIRNNVADLINVLGIEGLRIFIQNSDIWNLIELVDDAPPIEILRDIYKAIYTYDVKKNRFSRNWAYYTSFVRNPNTPIDILKEIYKDFSPQFDLISKYPTYKEVLKELQDRINMPNNEEVVDIPLSINEPQE